MDNSFGVSQLQEQARALAQHLDDLAAERGAETSPSDLIEPPAAPGIDPAWITPQGALRLRPDLWPERGGMDGFFIMRLRKSPEGT